MFLYCCDILFSNFWKEKPCKFLYVNLISYLFLFYLFNLISSGLVFYWPGPTVFCVNNKDLYLIPKCKRNASKVFQLI